MCEFSVVNLFLDKLSNLRFDILFIFINYLDNLLLFVFIYFNLFEFFRRSFGSDSILLKDMFSILRLVNVLKILLVEFFFRF